ncbi:MAG: hypothetical protein KJ915_07350 [Candidatus Omnitrophica bacterium]|nr:hypothetical protein [Candidatus Omnitrophota bacterium]
MNTKEYQSIVCEKLREIFLAENIKNEWDAAKDSQDSLTRGMYCPRLDIAVGPFNINGRVEANKRQIEEARSRHQDLIGRIVHTSERHHYDVQDISSGLNKNPRCLLAIEIEASGSRKHMLGDIANASILGSIGIVVPLTTGKLNAFIKIMKYIKFATKVKKLESSFNNVVIIGHDRFLEVLARSR